MCVCLQATRTLPKVLLSVCHVGAEKWFPSFLKQTVSGRSRNSKYDSGMKHLWEGNLLLFPLLNVQLPDISDLEETGYWENNTLPPPPLQRISFIDILCLCKDITLLHLPAVFNTDDSTEALVWKDGGLVPASD